MVASFFVPVRRGWRLAKPWCRLYYEKYAPKCITLQSNNHIVMTDNIVYVKNMVCRRCIMTVANVFKENGVMPTQVELGKVFLSEPLERAKMDRIRKRLEEYGFEVIDDRRMRLLEQIRVGIIEYVHSLK